MKKKKETTRKQRIKAFIERCKFFKEHKYFKNNKVSCAAYDSWAARGQAGGCDICKKESYNYSLHNKRNTGIHKHWAFGDLAHLCEECYIELESQCNYKFIKY